MTTLIPKPTLGDKILAWFGKYRAYRFPRGMYAKYGPFAIGMAGKEPFLRALLRRKGTPPPAGWFTIEDPLEPDTAAPSRSDDYLIDVDSKLAEKLKNTPLDPRNRD